MSRALLVAVCLSIIKARAHCRNAHVLGPRQHAVNSYRPLDWPTWANPQCCSHPAERGRICLLIEFMIILFACGPVMKTKPPLPEGGTRTVCFCLYPSDGYRLRLALLLFVGCLTSEQHAGVSQGRSSQTIVHASARRKESSHSVPVH